MSLLIEAIRTEAVVNLTRKRERFFAQHPGATLSYASPTASDGKHSVTIRVGVRSFRGTDGSYEGALTRALANAMARYYRIAHGRSVG